MIINKDLAKSKGNEVDQNNELIQELTTRKSHHVSEIMLSMVSVTGVKIKLLRQLTSKNSQGGRWVKRTNRWCQK